MVARPTADSRARSSAIQCRRARAARICAGVSGLGLILTSYELYDLIPIIQSETGNAPVPKEDVIFDAGGRREIKRVDKALREPPRFHRRLGRSDHHGRR